MIGNIPYYDVGVTVGRFSHADLGHKTLFDTGLSLCRRFYIIVGSAQERATLRNPFSVETRIKVIREFYPDIPESRLIIGGLNDLKNELNANQDWGEYVKSHVESKFHKFANVMIHGQEENRNSWFSMEALFNTVEVIVPRSKVPISATMMRGFLTIDDEVSWQKYMPELTHYMYQELRNELLEVPVYKELYNSIHKLKVVDIDAFMEKYEKYEIRDKQIKIAELQK